MIRLDGRSGGGFFVQQDLTLTGIHKARKSARKLILPNQHNAGPEVPVAMNMPRHPFAKGRSASAWGR